MPERRRFSARYMECFCDSLLTSIRQIHKPRPSLFSWFRIQEMFRFQSPRMHEIIGSAIVVAAASAALIKRLGMKTISS